MDLMTIIDKYITLSIKRDDLNKIISNCDRNINYAIASGDEAFSEGMYKLEKSYNDSVNDSKYRKVNASYELARVNVLLQEVHGLYTKTVSEMRTKDLEDNKLLCFSEILRLEASINELEQRRKFAMEKGDEAFKINSFYQEEFYNNICNECFEKIEDLKPKLHYYKSFELDLQNRLDMKNSNGNALK